MTRSKIATVSAVVAGALALGAGALRAAEPSAEQLRQQIEQLQAKVQQLETTQQTQAQQFKNVNVDATVDKVLSDAAQRSQLMQADVGFMAGWQQGKGFLIQDPQGNWVLHPFLQFQFRNVTNVRQSGAILDVDDNIIGYDGDGDIQNGFEVRRLKIGIDGKAFNPKLAYYFLWATSASSGALSLEQAWVKYSINNSWHLRGGQIRNPVFHEQDTSSHRQLGTERTVINQLITGASEPFTQSVSAIFDDKTTPVTAEFGISDGFITGNTTYVDTPAGNWGMFGRVNYFLMGNNARTEYADFSAIGNKEQLLVIGGGLDVTQAGDSNAYRWTTDAQWENTAGLGVYAAVIGKYADNAGSGNDACDIGLLAEAGYMLNDKWEVFGRGAVGLFDVSPDPVTGDDTFCEITVGVNWYVWGNHAAKFTLDATILPSGAPEDIAGLSVLASDELEAIVRAQFQLLL